MILFYISNIFYVIESSFPLCLKYWKYQKMTFLMYQQEPIFHKTSFLLQNNCMTPKKHKQKKITLLFTQSIFRSESKKN